MPVTPEAAIPDTWTKMDQVIAYWQAMGVDGFRCDMSHMVPPEFWKWLIARARQRAPSVYLHGRSLRWRSGESSGQRSGHFPATCTGNRM